MRICFITYEGGPSLTTDDQLLANYLGLKGISVGTAAWSDDTIDWTSFDMLILRSTWDYHLKIEKFNAWLNKILYLRCRVMYPVAVVKWNQNKKYLAGLRDMGNLVPPFIFCSQNSNKSLVQILNARGWSKAVIKPAISGGSYNTWVSSISSAHFDEHKFLSMLAKGDVIVQKFMNEVVNEGELSLMFFNKKYSHAALKKTKRGDFRMQSQFGGTTEKARPGNDIIDCAGALLADIEESLLYARVDAVISNNQFYLMELELIEPALFIASDPGACENFYQALLDLR